MAMKRDVDEVIDEAKAATFSGWDFSWLAGRAQETQPPWNYKEEAAAAFRVTLDVDTGGDEVLAQLAPFRGRVVATEGYLPTIAIAAARLIPLGAAVVGTRSAPDNVLQYPLTTATPASTSSFLPFRDGSFNLVLDRHSSFWPSEVHRVLAVGGVFLTQQRSVDATSLFAPDPSGSPPLDVGFAVTQLERHGFRILRSEEVQTPISFLDIGALVYYLRAVPWLVPNFDARTRRDDLGRLNDRIVAEGGPQDSRHTHPHRRSISESTWSCRGGRGLRREATVVGA
jgi:hypothetical protein